MRQARCLGAALTAFLFMIGEIGQAGIMTYTDRASFDLALIGLGYTSQTIDFDGEVDGSIVPHFGSVGAITFQYGLAGGAQLMVSDEFATTSGANFLGTDDGSFSLQDGDSFTMSFSPRAAIGLYLISIDQLFDGDFELTVGGSTASLAVSDQQQTLVDGASVYFLGLVDDSTSFTSATLSTHGPGGAFLYNVDDILLGYTVPAAVPEPSCLLALISLIPISARRLRNRNSSENRVH